MDSIDTDTRTDKSNVKVKRILALAMQSLPTHLAEIKWTNSPVPLA
jgi:hypothetical protein